MTNRNGFRTSPDSIDDELQRTGRMTAEFETELARLRQSMVMTGREVGTLSAGIERGLRGAFDGLILEGGKLSDALKEIGLAISDTIFSIAMRPVEQAIADSLAGGIGGLMAGVLPFAKGGAFQQGRVVPFAQGGVVDSPVHFPMRGATGLMGEAGPEAIMPLRRGPDGRLGVAAASGGRAVNVTINVTTPDVAGFQRSQSQIAAQMARVLARGDRNG